MCWADEEHDLRKSLKFAGGYAAYWIPRQGIYWQRLPRGDTPTNSTDTTVFLEIMLGLDGMLRLNPEGYAFVCITKDEDLFSQQRYPHVHVLKSFKATEGAYTKFSVGNLPSPDSHSMMGSCFGGYPVWSSQECIP
jgi:hypothetical protein